MITEIAMLLVKPGMEEEFERDFAIAGQYISSIDGYIAHSLSKCLEVANKYMLRVKWDSLEAHTIGFRTSDVYQKWSDLLHDYYDPFPIVEHYVEI